MKKLRLLIVFILIIAVSPFVFRNAYADDTYVRPVYALINSESCMLYRSDSGLDVEDNYYFVLPATYFVEILDNGESYHRVKYLDLTGYVNVSDVDIVDYLPVTAYPSEVTFVPDNDGFGVHLRRNPKKTAEILVTIPSGTENVTYYGCSDGEEAVNSYGNAWYYAEFDGYYGYVYNFYISINSIIPENIIEKIPESVKTPTDNDLNDIPKINDLTQIIIIIALIIPALLIIYLLFRRKNPAVQREESEERPTRKRKPKYYKE